MTESEYELWFDKYLGEVESLDSYTAAESPFANIPKPLNRKGWTALCSLAILCCIGGSCLLAYLYELYGVWVLNWICNVLLSLSIGLIASLILMIYSNTRERNIAFYSDLIPVLEKRHSDMQEAYLGTVLKIQRRYQEHDFEMCYQAWHANSNACYVILGFLRYLHKALPFTPDSLNINAEKIDSFEDEIYKANNQIQTEFFKGKTISSATVDKCIRATDSGGYALSIIEDLINEFRKNLYRIKYGKDRIKNRAEYTQQQDAE